VKTVAYPNINTLGYRRTGAIENKPLKIA